MNQEKDEVQNELMRKQTVLMTQQQEKEEMNRIMQELNDKLMIGGQQLEEKEAEQLREKREY